MVCYYDIKNIVMKVCVFVLLCFAYLVNNTMI